MAKKTVPTKTAIVTVEQIASRIFLIRGHKVMLSTHLAALYGIEPRALVQAVKRNRKRFPSDFMFQLSAREFANLKSQIVISSWGGSRRAAPYAFTEHGAIMLASVLNSPVAVQASIRVVRAFIKLRELLGTQHKLALKLLELENRLGEHDHEITALFEAIRRLMEPPDKPGKPIGFHS
jgi:hypothetical protein